MILLFLSLFESGLLPRYWVLVELDALRLGNSLV